MHPVAAGTLVNLAQPVHTGCSTVWAMHWPICRSSPKSRRFTVEPGRAIDASSCIRNLRSFACHRTDEIKTVWKNSSGVTIPVFPLLWHVAHRRTNCLYFCLPIIYQRSSVSKMPRVNIYFLSLKKLHNHKTTHEICNTFNYVSNIFKLINYDDWVFW